MRAVRNYAAVAVVVMMVGLAGCGSSGGSDGGNSGSVTSAPAQTTTTREATTTTEEPTTTTTAPKLPQVGETSQSGGISATLRKVSEAQSIKVNQTMYETGSGYDTLTDLQAGDGAKFIVVEATIKNDTKSSIDLTCSYPVKTLVLDLDRREFDPIEDLSDIPGNPACNFALQPGFDAPITYVYRLPVDAEPLAWYVEDVTDFGATEEGTAFEITGS